MKHIRLRELDNQIQQRQSKEPPFLRDEKGAPNLWQIGDGSSYRKRWKKLNHEVTQPTVDRKPRRYANPTASADHPPAARNCIPMKTNDQHHVTPPPRDPVKRNPPYKDCVS
jgi:hypothetical protein